jgi:MSHA pilin protein MshC
VQIKLKGYASKAGFSLIELIAVIVLLGVISVSVAPRFLGSDSFSSYTVRDQIITAARLAQQRAMYDHSGNCYRLQISGGFISVQDSASTYTNLGPDQSWVAGLAIDGSVTVNGGADISIYFDGLGNAIGTSSDCGGSPVSTPITITGGDTLGVCLHAAGYIQAQAC